MAPSLSPLSVLSVVLVVTAVLYQSYPLRSSPSLTLAYFDVPGRAEATRVALRLGGVAFHDERLARDAFLQRKPSLPFGQVPVLTIDGETFAESQAILRYAGRVAGLVPTDNAVAALLVDEIVTAVDEVNEIHITPTRREKDLTKQQQMREAAVAGPLPVSLATLDARVEHVAAMPYFRQYRDKVFLHEIAVWRLVSTFQSATLDHIPASVTDAYATLNAVHAKVDAALAKLSADDPASPSNTPAKDSVNPTSLTLTYFDFTGRAEPVRLALHIGGRAFTDERLGRDAFLERKPTLPYKQVPVLTVDGVTAAQSFSLLRYAGSLSGLYPLDDPVEALKIDEIIARVEDIYYALAPSGKETDVDKKRAMREQLSTERLPAMLAQLNTRVQARKGSAPFVLGTDTISVADLVVFSLVQFFQGGLVDFVPSDLVDAYDALLAVNDAVRAHPRVVDWYAQVTK